MNIDMQSLDQPPVRILVVDDHTLFRRGLTALLARDPRLKVIDDAADASQAQRKAKDLQPDLILLDIHLPGVNGIDALPALLEAAPNARVLMLTVSEDENNLSAALSKGACGYLLKTIESDDLTAAIFQSLQGDSVIAPEMTSKLVSAYLEAANQPIKPITSVALAGPMDSLSARELEILSGIVRGASNKEIARELGIAEATVKIHVQHVLRKLKVSSRVHAAVIANESGLI